MNLKFRSRWWSVYGNLSPFMREWPGLVPLLLPSDVVRDKDKNDTDHNKQTAKDLSQQVKYYNTINFLLC